jgi:DNA-binding transcriptional MerR regulator
MDADTSGAAPLSRRGDGLTASSAAGGGDAAPVGRVPIKEAARRTGVPAHTLRAWERRYGIPAPSRTAARHRLYDAADLLLIERMNRAVRAGAAHAEAARQAKSEAATSPATAADAGRVQADLSTAFEARDRQQVFSVLTRALALSGVSGMLSRVLRPAIDEVRIRVDASDDETLGERLDFALDASRQWLDALRAWADDGRGPRAVIVAAPGEGGDPGTAAIALLMALSGWSPVVVDGDAVGELTTAVRAHHPAIVAMSIEHNSHVAAALMAAQAIGRRLGPDIPIVLAGRAAGSVADLPEGVQGEAALAGLLSSVL